MSVLPLVVHVLAGGMGLLSGYVALAVSKGGSLHRKAGMLFVCVMTTMAMTGMLISAVEGVAPEINLPSALLTIYLVITALVIATGLLIPIASLIYWSWQLRARRPIPRNVHVTAHEAV